MDRQRAGIYARNSKDKSRSVAEQEAENRRACQRHGWQVAVAYSDGESASRFASRQRENWSRLLADLAAHRFDVLVLWEPSRGDRDPETWFPLLGRCRDGGVKLYITSHDRLYDPQNPRDWRSLAEDGIDSAYESEKMSMRLRRAHAALAAAGRPSGHVPYGYLRRYHPVTRTLVEQEPDPATAPIVREVITAVGEGVPISVLTERLNQRGVPAPGGGRWDRKAVRRLAVNPVYFGKRRHRGVLHDAVWPALITDDVWYAAQRVLTDPARRTTRPGRARHLLTGIATCAVCASVLGAHGGKYACQRFGCVTVKESAVDELIVDRIVDRLSQPDMREAFSLVAGSDAEVTAARAEVAELRARLDAAADQYAAGQISAATLARVEAQLTPRIDEAQRRAVRAATPPTLRVLLDPDVGIRQAWDRLHMGARREVVRTLLTAIVVRPAARRGGNGARFDPGRVEVVWRTEDVA
ncbi:MAG TPA: recombinase family protein [Micromonosporaceae bacterium]